MTKEVDDAIARTLAAADEDAEEALLKEVGTPQESKFGWLRRLPRNIGVGAYKAALSMVDTMDDITAPVGQAAADLVSMAPNLKSQGIQLEAGTSLREIAPGFMQNAHAFADEVTANNTIGDDITQGVAQFALPFAAWMKGLTAIGVGGRIAAGVAAETATAATAFDPHDGRFADLAQMGRDSETKFGEVLRRIAPDGSLLNNYIDYITAREDEGEWEGRWKNAVDSLATTAVLGGLLKGAATGFRAGRRIMAEPMKVGPGAQRGAVGVSPSDELTDIERARALKNTQVEEGGEHIVLEGDTLNQNADVVPLKPPATLRLFRGARPGRDPRGTQDTLGGALFYTPDVATANVYGRYGGDVASDLLTFNNLLETSTWAEAKTRLRLPESSSMRDLVAAAREAGYDGVTFDTKTGKEYIAIPENMRPGAVQKGKTAPGVANTPEELAKLLEALNGA